MAEIIIQLPSDFIVTLEKFWRDQFSGDKPTVSLRTLQDQACGGKFPGAFRIEGRWYVNKLALAQLGMNVGRTEEAAEAPQALGETPGLGGNRKGRGKVASKKAKKGPPPALRYAPGD